MNERDIFDNALALSDPVERAEYLDNACGDDRHLRAHIEGLLTVHGKLGGFLESPAVATAEPASDLAASAIGSRIGPYKLREQIGEGGMGVVYVAEQTDPIKRKVALKIIKPGMASRDVVTRFEAERQALAMMDHPSIAKVFDGGATDSGQPYFVMELVQGPPLTEYCDQHRFTTRQRLELFEKVCRAVQHAHQKGVIHRDLKPTNVLVPRIDGQPVPKVIDFGVAKAVGQKLTEQTVYTQFAQLVGTPLYMSPEQTELGVVDIDTRSDVYSLGVLLYELLTGSTPFDGETLKQAGFDEMRRIIREDEPLRPSVRVSTLAARDLSTVAERRGSDARQLRASLKGELDWLVMKALEKDRARRYGSASALADDVERYLANQPIAARPPSVAYRLKKYAQRNKARLIPATLVAVVLLIGLSFALAAALNERFEKLSLLNETAERLYVSRMRQGMAAWNAHDYGELNSLLESTAPRADSPDYRDWEWYFLKQQSRLLFAVVPAGEVSQAAWHPTLNQIAVCVRRPDGHSAIEIWEPDNPARLRELIALPETFDSVRALRWSADGSRLTIGHGYGVVAVVDAQTGHVVVHQRLNQDTSGVKFMSAIDLSPSGDILATASFFGHIRTWKLAKGASHDADLTSLDVLLEPGNTPRNVSSIAFSPDGNQLAACLRLGEVRLWDLRTSTSAEFERIGNGSGGAIAWRPDGSSFAATDAHSFAIYRPGTKEPVATFPQLNAQSACWIGNDILATGGQDHAIRLWNIETQEALDALQIGHTTVTLFGASQDAKYLAAECDGELKVIRHSEAKGPRVIHPEKRSAGRHVVRWSHSGTTLASAHNNGELQEYRPSLKVVDAQSGAVLMEHAIGINPKIEWARDDRSIHVIDEDGGPFTVSVAGVRTQNQRDVTGLSAAERTSDVSELAINRQRELIASVERNDAHQQVVNNIHVRRLGEPAIIDTFDIEDSWAVDMSWSPDSRLLGVTYLQKGNEWNVLVYDAERMRHARRLLAEKEEPWPRLAWNPDSTELALGTGAGKILILDATSLETRATLLGHRAPIQEVAWSPSGTRIASCALDGTVRIWDALHGDEVGVIELPDRPEIYSVDWSSDGRKLAAGVANGEIYIFDAGPAFPDARPTLSHRADEGRQRNQSP